jgi:hypothetical protein
MAQLGADIEVIEGDELKTAFARLATRLSRAAGSATSA